MRQLIELLSSVRSHNHWVRLNVSTRSDLTWWRLFLEGWNGVSLLPDPEVPTVVLETDASGSWGCGACSRWGWLQWQWEPPANDWHISAKELLPILLAVAVWGENWVGQSVECRCDNMAVDAVVNAGRSRDTAMMHLLRCLFFMVARLHVRIKAVHIPGTTNVAADALSRNDIPRFLQAVPEATGIPTPVPQRLVDLMVREWPDWTSCRWAELFKGCCRQA